MGLDMYLVKAKGKWTQGKISKRDFLRFQAYSQSSEIGKVFDMENPLEIMGNLASWCKHSELHEYLQEVYIQTTPIEYQGIPFYWTCIVLEREMVYDILSKAKQRIEQIITSEKMYGSLFSLRAFEDWKDTIEVFERVLNEVDFENETILYSAH